MAKHYHITRTSSGKAPELETKPLMFRSVRADFKRSRAFWAKHSGKGIYYSVDTTHNGLVVRCDAIFGPAYEVVREEYAPCDGKLSPSIECMRGSRSYAFKVCSKYAEVK